MHLQNSGRSRGGAPNACRCTPETNLAAQCQSLMTLLLHQLCTVNPALLNQQSTLTLLNPPSEISRSALASAPGPLFILGFERAWSAKIRHMTSLSTSVGVSMETPSFTMTSFQSAYGQVVAWCEYSSSETDGRIAS